MKPTPAEFEPIITRFAERLAKLRPEMAPHLDTAAAAIDARFAFDRQDAADSALDDVAAINSLFAQQD